MKIVNNISIGEHHPCFIIAEIGSNHNQDLELAYETIDAAVMAGANAVKFQSININELYHKPSSETIQLHQKIDLEESWHSLLKEYCDKKGIIFFSSPTYLRAIDILEDINVPLYKLASAQIGTFPQLVEKVSKLNKPTILSTGIVSYGALENIVRIFKQNGNDKYIILHCNSIYPTPYDRVNLRLMDTYRQMFDCVVGFSDHTEGIYIPIGAVAQGAKVIEKHFALSRNLPVPDAPFSLEPDELKQMVDGIRAVEKASKTSVRTELQAEEKQFKNSILHRIVAKRDIQEGEKLSDDNIEYKRYTEGIDCRRILKNNSCITTQDIEKGTVLQQKDITF